MRFVSSTTLAGFLCACIFAPLSQAASTNPTVKSPDAPQIAPTPKWLLPAFLKLADQNPNRLLRLGAKLFSEERLRISSVDAHSAYEWQHRLAMVQALATFFADGVRPVSVDQKKGARKLMQIALHKDPSLLVRDGAVEAIRNIIRTEPSQAKQWRGDLEEAFLEPQNVVKGEGLFIRETILVAIREASLPLSSKIREAANKDASSGVKAELMNVRK